MHWVVIDLDQTLIDTRDLVISGGPEPEVGTAAHDTWRETVTAPDALRVAPAIEPMLRLIKSIDAHSVRIVFLTNRRESLRPLTDSWLLNHGLYYPLLMRPNDTHSRTGDFKAGVIKTIAGVNDTVLVIDDDDSLEAVCRENGWMFLKAVTYE